MKCSWTCFNYFLLSLILNSWISADPLSNPEQKMQHYVYKNKDAAISFLERIVNINSGTMNHEGVRRVGKIFEDQLADLGFSTRWIPMHKVNRAGHLFAELKGKHGNKLLLIGHLDTVFERASSFQKFQRQGSTAKGPGVVDMKGGNVVILYALKALHSIGELRGANITVALIGDEEDTGDPISLSRHDLVKAASQSDSALAFEGAGGMGSATVARRGYTDWFLKVTSKTGHSSQIFGDAFGAGAINEVSRILSSFYKELRGEKYLTFSPGLILGGTTTEHDQVHSRGTAFGKSNVIPATAVVSGDLRFISEDQRERAKIKMRKIVLKNLPQSKANITFQDSYPAMSPTTGNYLLLDKLAMVSQDLGQGPVRPIDPLLRGAADISFAAPHVKASLDGLGVAGTGSHTVDETIDLDSLPPSIIRAAVLIYRLTRNP